MSKKKRRKPTGSAKSLHDLDSGSLERRARESAAAGRWRDAIAAYKDLLKREPRDEWRDALADAYAGRATELSDKGMHKEALAIWENRAALIPDEPMHPAQGALLVRLGRTEQMVALLADGDALPRVIRESLREQFAARVLGGDLALMEQLPADDPVRRHAEAALSALAAYCGSDDDALRAALAAIPFRSPYRAWALVLKALLARESAPQEVATQLARIGDDSAFGPFKRAALLSLEPEETFLTRAAEAPPLEGRVACVLRGWPPERIALWEDLVKAGIGADAAPDPRSLVRVMQRNARLLDGDWVRRKTLSLAVRSDQDAIRFLRACASPNPSRWERALLTAWEAEQERDPWEMLEAWQRCAQLLQSNRDAGDPQSAMRIALMLRRTDAQAKLLGTLPATGDRDFADTEAARQVEESLSWDPDDRDSYLRLIGYYRRGGKRKDVRRLLEAALKRWPQSLPVLEAAMDSALDSGAFKKAAGFARKILAVDPINTGVRSRLITAHLAHARKQVQKGRIDLARKELGLAGDWAKSDDARAQLALITRLLDLAGGQRDALGALQAHYARRGKGYDAWLELLLAAELIGSSRADLQKQLRLKNPKAAGPADLTATIGRLRTHMDQHGTPDFVLTNTLDATLSRAPWKMLSHSELETACDTLRRAQTPKARLSAANAALKHSRDEPLFVLHRFEAKFPYGFDFSDFAEIDRLRAALDRAHEEGDTRTAVRIQQAMPGGAGFPGMPPPPPVFFDDEEGEDGELDFDPLTEMLSAMIDDLGVEGVLKQLGAPKPLIREIKKIERQLGPDAAAAVLADALSDLLPGGPGAFPLPRVPMRNPFEDSADDEDDDPPIQTSLF